MYDAAYNEKLNAINNMYDSLAQKEKEKNLVGYESDFMAAVDHWRKSNSAAYTPSFSRWGEKQGEEYTIDDLYELCNNIEKNNNYLEKMKEKTEEYVGFIKDPASLCNQAMPPVAEIR